MEQKADLTDIAKVFLKLGIIGFGGPAAHIAMMQDEVVRKRAWLSEQHFLDLVGATQLIPGPNSTELAIHIGREKAGWKGLLLAGGCFILPAVLLTAGLAWLYKSYGEMPMVQPFLYGVQPAIIAIILMAILPMARKSLKSIELLILGVLVLIGARLHVAEAYLIFGSGLVAMAWAQVGAGKRPSARDLLPLHLAPFGSGALPVLSSSKLFWIFLKIGAILYGSGYVLFAYLDTELVATGWLTRQQLMDAIVVGQFTPGPVFSAVTFVGYQIQGWSGALIATVAIFLPSFLFVALLNPLVKKMRSSASFSVFLDAVNVASIAVIVAICIEMGEANLMDWRRVLIGVVSLGVLYFYKNINSAYIVIGSAVAGYLLLSV